MSASLNIEITAFWYVTQRNVDRYQASEKPAASIFTTSNWFGHSPGPNPSFPISISFFFYPERRGKRFLRNGICLPNCIGISSQRTVTVTRFMLSFGMDYRILNKDRRIFKGCQDEIVLHRDRLVSVKWQCNSNISAIHDRVNSCSISHCCFQLGTEML
jgi:hypothetical protein